MTNAQRAFLIVVILVLVLALPLGTSILFTVNERELAVVLRFGRWSQVPRETLMGDKDPDAVLGSLRATLTRVIPDRGLGRFGLVPTQQVPLNAFVSLKRLQRALDQRGQINALFAGAAADDPVAALREAL